jgi:glycosyltransferase involved in cell wall biosynthesis
MGRGGEGVHIHAIFSALQSLGHSIQLVGPPGINTPNDQTKWPVDKTTSNETGLNKLWKTISRRAPQWLFELMEFAYNFWAIPRLMNATRNSSFIYERYAFFLWAGALVTRMRRIPLLLEVNEIAGLKRARKQTLTCLASRIEKLVFKRAAAIFVVSSALKNRMISSGIEANKIFIQPNAIDPRSFSVDMGEVLELRTRLNLQGSVVMGFVGWFDEWDNLETLIERMPPLLAAFPNLRLMLVGSGTMMNRLTLLVDRLGIKRVVLLTGPVERSEIPKYIAAMDICLIPDSNIFGSPLVLFEYMALGKPIIAKKLAPITDVIDDEHTGLIFENLSDPCFDTQLLRLLRDASLRKLLGDNARISAHQNHTWIGNAEKIIRAYQLATAGIGRS